MKWVDGTVYSVSNWNTYPLEGINEVGAFSLINNMIESGKVSMDAHSGKGNCTAMWYKSTHVSFTLWIRIPCSYKFSGHILCENDTKYDSPARGTVVPCKRILQKVTKFCPLSWTYVTGACYKLLSPYHFPALHKK